MIRFLPASWRIPILLLRPCIQSGTTLMVTLVLSYYWNDERPTRMKGFSKLIEAIAFRVHSIRHCLRLSPQFFPCPMNAPTWCLWALHFGSNFFTQAADTSWFEAVSTTTHIIPSCFCEQVHVSPACCCWLLFFVQYSFFFIIIYYNNI